MGDSRAGHHGDVLYVFEDSGFNSAPNDDTEKVFGGDATLETFDGSQEAVRVFNGDRYAAEVIEQVFDGSWSVTGKLTEPPWWLAGLFGQPTKTNVSGNLYEFSYDLGNSNDPVSLRLYLPTEGFSDYRRLTGCVISDVTLDQSVPGHGEFTINGAYASEPDTDSSLTLTVPNFAEETLRNRDAELIVDGDTVGRAQSASASLAGNTELIDEIGSGEAVDFSPKAWEPDLDMDHIVSTSQTVDFFSTFQNFNRVTTELDWDNGQSGDNSFYIRINMIGSVPNQFTESGRNDPDADLVDELSWIAEDTNIIVADDQSDPPGITL